MSDTPSGEPTRLSIIIPVHCEEVGLPALLAEIEKALAGSVEVDILVIDDGSPKEVLPFGRVRVKRLPRRRGTGFARKVGVKEASSRFICWMDGDGTYDPADLPEMLKLLGRYDQIIGARRCDHGPIGSIRFGIKRGVAAICSLLWRERIPDHNSGLRLFRGEALREWIDQVPDGFSCTTTATLAALNRGQSICFYPINYRSRQAGSHSKFRPLIDGGKLLATVCRLYHARVRSKGTPKGRSFFVEREDIR